MNEKININEGGEGIWSIPKENQTNVLDKVRVEFEEGESPVEYDSSKIEMSMADEGRAKNLVTEMEYENRLLSREDARELGVKVLERF